MFSNKECKSSHHIPTRIYLVVATSRRYTYTYIPGCSHQSSRRCAGQCLCLSQQTLSLTLVSRDEAWGPEDEGGLVPHLYLLLVPSGMWSMMAIQWADIGLQQQIPHMVKVLFSKRYTAVRPAYRK